MNGTYYGSQKPESFQKWHDETPEGFVFSLKAPRYATNRKVLADAGETIERFLNSGVTLLGDKLGPINWQFMATKKFDPVDFEAFLKLLPPSHEGRALRHVVEVRHDSFRVPEFIELIRAHHVAAVLSADGEFPQIADPTADFVYARIMGTAEDEAWATAPRCWTSGRNGPGPGLRAVRPRGWTMSETPPGRGRAMSIFTSSAATRSGIRMRPWR